jgi:hypothetical protein
MIRSLLIPLLALGAVACQSDKPSAPVTEASKMPVCAECYSAVSAAQRAEPIVDADRNETLKTYECPCCTAEMSVYIEDGTYMVKCGGCAREGVAWDQCRPVDMSAE